MSCDIVIAVWNLKKYTQNCIESIIKNTGYPYRLIVTDNGSEAETKKYLEGLKNDPRLKDHDYTLIRNEENLGATKALNQGLELSKGDYAMILNNDTIVAKGWLSKMIRTAESSKDIGIVNPNSNNLGSRAPWWMPLEKYAERLEKKYKDRYMEMATAVGFCYMVKREVINKIGLLSEEYGLGNFEETEYSIRAARAGYKSVFSIGSYVWHKEHASFDLISDFEEMFEKNQKMFYEMFGRPQRVLYILTHRERECFNKLKGRIHSLANNCNRVRIASRAKLDKTHANIMLSRCLPLFFRARWIFKVISKKKKFDRILTNDRILFRVLMALKKFHRAKLIELRNYIFFEDSEFLRINLGCLGRACYGYVNIDEKKINKRALHYSFSDLPFEDRIAKNILLDYNVILEKTDSELDAIFKEFERIAVPGCVLSIDNFSDKIEKKLTGHNFIRIAPDYNRIFSARSFIYNAPYAKEGIKDFLEDLGQKDDVNLRVLNERFVSDKGEYVNFFDKASIAQILEENDFYIERLEVRGPFIEVRAIKRKNIVAMKAGGDKKRICSIGQYMLWRYRGLGFDWDEWPRCFEKLDMDYLLIEGMRNIETERIRKAILDFRPHYLLVVLKDTLPIIRDIKKELKALGTKVIYWFCDPEIPKKEDFSDVIDFMFLTNRGQLAEYKTAYNLESVYYMPQGFGPYAQHRLELPEIYDVGFAGAISSAPLHRTRKELIDAMSRRYNVKTNNAVRNNIAEFYSQSKTVFGASDFNSELYTSNRFYVALGCGACYITKKFQGIELLAKNKEHVLWFEDKKELFDILDYYLSHDSERNMIREAASKLAMERHTYEHRLRNILDIVEGRTKSFYGFL